MNLPDNINEIWGKGEYEGLRHEVYVNDCYKLRELNFIPTLVFDLGANVSTFTSFAQSLWPGVKIIAIEPHKDNCEAFLKYANMDNVTLLPMAIGMGNMYYQKSAGNGSGEVYVSGGVAYPDELMKDAIDNKIAESSAVESIMPSDLFNLFYKEGDKVIVKIDIEGNETIIFQHEPSMQSLFKADYICIEIHNHALNGEIYPDVVAITQAALKIFEHTHNCSYNHPMFYAKKRN